ncbi:hypothetical protein MNBD_GAMMA07-689 [hydrothermal vent metagenome]|uniref:DUF3570 domain-containing protein n=1 Tax=hydrothermal vent metagenome TaxID=652676 RepID=A0A3B0X3D3_9ZZZZ
MQLNNIKCPEKSTKHKNSIKGKLTVATCALLQVTGVAQAKSDDWDVKSAFLYYAEDGRINVFEPVVSAKKEINDEEFLSFKVVYDVLSGSTPYGALPSDSPQTVTNPSGNSTYTAAAGELPLNSTFRDTRVAVNADWTVPLSRLNKVSLGANFSNEFDFVSAGVSANYTHDSIDRNTSYNIGVGFNSETWDPVGGKNTEFDFMIAPLNDPLNISGTAQPKGGTDTKTSTDIILGLTQVINRSTIMQFNLGVSTASGYLTDPYRFISVVDGITGRPADITTLGLTGDELPYIYEKRPDTRTKNTFFWRTAHHLTEDVINFSYRFYTDDWGIDAHTLDFRYRYEMGGDQYLQPHIRYYTQNAADFYVHSLTAGEALPENASSDYRLGEFVTTTIGLKYGMKLGEESEFNVRLELINQSYNTVGTLIGIQNNFDIVPDLDAVVLQMGYNFRW